MSNTTFYISFEGDHYLTLDELWPDGDAPGNPTVEDVRALVNQYSLPQLLNEWNLSTEVYVDGPYHSRG